jgi:hypothetical protein
MKLNFTKSIDKERLRGRAEIDRFFVPLINGILGDKHALYVVKYTAAVAHLSGTSSALVEDDDEARTIIERHTSSLDALATIEQRRQALQSRIDACNTAAEVDALLAKVLTTSK